MSYNPKNWKLHPRQKAFLESKEKELFYGGGARSRYSDPFLRKLFEKTVKLDHPNYDNRNGAIIIHFGIDELPPKKL